MSSNSSLTMSANPAQPASQDEYLFVYGTLLRKLNLACFRFLTPVAEYVCEAQVRGELWDLGSYPGLCLNEQANLVKGELFKLTNNSNWQTLDEYEDYQPSDPANSLYLRVATPIVCEHSTITSAWVYHYQGSLQLAKAISSGDYYSYRRKLAVAKHTKLR
ncbi:gamma-glutamylcyclotransferase [Pseudoalteromonas fenneropenaei]|uniref:Gamma-glutamylcyclotransferase n=1 Tax=Pseudoalteromonas fenneropenaei TaxID=1737459 RepID=A0ABV7CJG0_9GAMM